MTPHGNGQGGHYKPIGEARQLKSAPETKNGVRTGYYLARYVDTDGRTRQAGRHKRKGDANRASLHKVSELNATLRAPGGEITFTQWHELWPSRKRREQRTIDTNKHRIEKYILPHLPQRGNIPLRQITRATLHDIQIILLGSGLSKGTIDGVFSSLSAVLGYAIDEQRIEFNPAHRMRVDADDPLLNPARNQDERRYIPPEEFAAFYQHVKLQHRAVCLAPLATGCRTQELLALERQDHDPRRQLILTHQRARVLGGDPDQEGVLRPGLKTTRGIRRKTKQQRGRLTLYPAILLVVAPPRLHPSLMFPSPSGRVWGQRNFYRDVWEPASTAAGTDFTIHDLRHTFISHLLAAGIPAVEVSAYAGHSTRSNGELDNTTTRIYQHPTGEYRQAALKAINEYIAQLNIDQGAMRLAR
jgi:integrase